MEKEKTNNNFIMQAGILAGAGIIVRIIGILYRSPLVMIIGDEGNGYYNTAYNIYTIILLISSYSIPAAISKVIAARIGVGEYKNAFRLFVGSIVYVVVMGGIGSLVCLFGAESLAGESSAVVLRLFSPTIFLSGLLGCFRGFFQAKRTMVYTSISQILEQIANALISVGMAYVITSFLKGQDATTVAIGGASGSALGTGAGVLTALVFMAIVYIRKFPDYRLKMKEEEATLQRADLLKPMEILVILVSIVTPVIMSTCIYNLSTVVNQKIYQGMNIRLRGYTEAMAATKYGLFSGKAMNITNIPIAMAAAMSSAIIPAIAHSYERREEEETRRKIASATRVTMLIAIPCGFGLLALARPVTMLLYPQRQSVDMVANMIRALSITVVLYCLSTLGNAILQGTGRVGIPVRNAAIALTIQTIVLVLLVINTELDTYALCIAVIIYSLIMCVLNCRAIGKYNNYRQEIKRTFVIPIVAGAVMSIIAYGIFELLCLLFRLIAGDMLMEISGIRNALALVIAVVAGIVSYGLLAIKLGAATGEELRMLPGGRKILGLCKRFHLVK